MEKNNLKAVVFDLDGVLTDSAKYHYQAWKMLADKLGIPFDEEYNEKLKGVSRMESLELMYKQASISEFEHKIIELTEDKENQNIFYDAYAQESLYLHYKNRNPVNPGIYVLPWYMAWYEQDNINSVLENKPSVVVYNEDVEVWGYQYYSNGLVSVLKENGYERLSQDPNDGWEYCVWVR